MGTSIVISIHQLAEPIADVVGCHGRTDWNITKPDGMPKKQLDLGRIQKLGLIIAIPLEQGLQLTYADYQRRLAQKRPRSLFPIDCCPKKRTTQLNLTPSIK